MVGVVVLALGGGCTASSATPAQTRAYYIAAEEVAWNYAPAGTNLITGAPFDEEANTYVKAGADRIGATYTKCLYHGYTDASFTHQIPRPADEQYLGILGPVIRAQVGDTITVTFRNNCSFPARPDGSPADVDRELFALFMVDDENQSHYLEAERSTLAKPPAADDADFVESNKMHSINGYVYGNGPVMTMRQGQRVRWYVMSMGNEVDLHTPHWHGNTVIAGGVRTDTVSLLPAGMVVADMVPDDPGIWEFHCHVSDHILAGMLTRYQVLAPEQSGPS
jgi:FtsP/CotA-like multicopper oxidase with cupredoxin domain